MTKMRVKTLTTIADIAFCVSCVAGDVQVGNVVAGLNAETASPAVMETVKHMTVFIKGAPVAKNKKKAVVPQDGFEGAVRVHANCRDCATSSQDAGLITAMVRAMLTTMRLSTERQAFLAPQLKEMAIDPTPELQALSVADVDVKHATALLVRAIEDPGDALCVELLELVDSTIVSLRRLLCVEIESALSIVRARLSNAQSENRKGKMNVGSGVTALLQMTAQDRVEAWTGDKSASVLSALLAGSNESKKPKLPKGTRDFGAAPMRIREMVFDKIGGIFRRHGGVGLDTPVFELRETLMGKYGEDSKLIYDLADQGGELLSLRYDLTVPFARYLAMNNVGNIKRYHMAKVYRRDNISIEKGRFREFYQCDFDIAGNYDTMIPDAEVLKILSEILLELDIGQFQIKLNHRKLLDAMLAVCGVPDTLFRPICSAIDKLDKMSWTDVRQEMVEEKGLDPRVADRIRPLIDMKGSPRALLDQLRKHEALTAVTTVVLEEMETLFGYLDAYGVLQHVSFDLSLARGLTYYTGLIYEAVLVNGKSKVGSIAAGGRYDDLVGIFSSKNIPVVGMSVGIERIFSLVLKQEEEKQGGIRAAMTQVLVACVGPGLTQERMRICSELWEHGIAAELLYTATPTTKKQLNHALKEKIPLVVFIGAKELDDKCINLKDTRTSEQTSVPRSAMVDRIKQLLQ